MIKAVLAGLSLLVSTQFTFAQGNNCAGATTLTVNGACDLAASFTDATVNDPTVTTCGSAATRDGWYKFTATATSTTVTFTNSSNKDGAIYIYSGVSCALMTYSTCANTNGASGDETVTFTTIPATTYYVRIVRTSGTTGSLSGDVCITSPALPGCAVIGSPTSGTTGLCNSAVTLNWTAPTSGGAPTGYKLYFGTDILATNIVNGTNLGNVLTYTPSLLLAGTTYYWKIVATNALGDAIGCSIWSFTTSSPGCYYQQNGNITACGGSYYDSGGPSAQYANSESSVMTFCPPSAGNYEQVTFSAFSTELTNDVLTIFDGANTSAPVLATLSGTIVPCTITATNASGCLTFRFVSNASTRSSGWTAALSCVTTVPTPLTGTVCSNAPFMTLPYTATGQTTQCYGDDYNNSSVGSCGTFYESGEDRVYAYTAASAECIGISITNASTIYIGYELYSGCPGSAGTTCVASNGGSTSLSSNATLTAGTTYYLVIDTWASPNYATYDLAVTSFGSGPVNDLPCNATLLTLGVTQTGDNTCSGGTGEPAAPTCWTTGNNNSVWYKVVPTGTTLNIKTVVGTLTNTQMALYSGTCGASLTMVTSGCNDDAPLCGATSDYSSYLSMTGLTAGTTYYLRVDGYSNLVGSFGVIAVDGSASFPSIPGQDCGFSNPVCNSTMSISNPGYQGIGTSCDLPTSYCLTSGERGSVWYGFTTNAAGNVNFDIVPNDWPGAPSTTSTDYDFALFKMTSSSCAAILAGTNTPVACNYSSLGVTGVSPTGNAPAAYPGYNASYEPQVACAAGDSWIIVIQNYSNSTQGFTINFPTGAGAPPINYTPSPTSVSWSGGSSTAWNVASNWGGCAIPVCGIDANVSVFATQPALTSAMGAQYVRDLTINVGATLTLQAGSILHICGNFVNNGTIIASSTSSIIFDNATAAQSMTGNFTGSSKLGNLTITKTGGSVMANSDIDIGGTFTTSNATSIFNSNGKSIKVAGNFANATGNTTYTNTGTAGTLTFNGTAAQTYTQGTSQLDLNNVVMLHTGTGVTISTNMYIKASTGALTLTQGKIITGTNEVNVANTASAAVNAGNTTSFVQGNLRRYVASTGSYDFPVGHATKGYQLANINFTSATSIGNLLAKFTPWGVTPVTQGGSECTTTYNLPGEDSGWWTITADANPTTGLYTATLHPNGATNTAPASGWTVMKTPTVETGTWSLVGICGATSTATNVLRTGMSGFSLFAAAQATSPLPIELLSFTGKSEGAKNKLMWVTASETNNDYFTLERSETGLTFEAFTQVDGAGNSSVMIDYSTYDPSPYNGITYYRLKQTDFNGHYMYSPIIEVANKLDQIAVSNVHPNPTTDDLNFDFYSPVKGTIRILILDYTGRIVSDKTESVDEGKISLQTQMSELAKGIYSLKVEFSEGNFRSVTKIVKY